MSDEPTPTGAAPERKRNPRRPKRKGRGALVRRAVARKDEPARDEDDRKPEREREPATALKKPSASNRRIGIAAIGVAVALIGGGVYFATRAPEAKPTEVVQAKKGILDVIPSGALAVVTADVRALRASPLAAPYLGGSRSVPGFDDVRQACGFDLIASVDELAIAVPEKGDADFGIVATGGFSDAAILDCAAKVVKSRGGEPATTTIGSFKSVRDVSTHASSGETAARPGGMLLWGGGPYVRTMIDAADGAAPTLRSGSLHEKLRAELAGYETVQASYVFSEEQRRVVSDEIAQAQGRAPAVLAHVLGVGLGIRLVEQRTSLQLVLFVDDPSRAPELRAWLDETRTGAASGIASRLLGAGALLDRMTMEASGTVVRARLDATVAELDAVVERAIKVRAMLQQQQQEEVPAPEPGPPPDASASAAPSVQPSATVAPSASAAPSARPEKRR